MSQDHATALQPGQQNETSSQKKNYFVNCVLVLFAHFLVGILQLFVILNLTFNMA